MVTLSIIEKWSPERHGILESEINYSEFMKHKYLLITCNMYMDEGIDFIDEYLEIFDFSRENDHFYDNTKIQLIKYFYIFKGRTFVIQNKGIELFQKKWRKYYKKYISPKRCPKNLRLRELYGKYVFLNFN